MHNPEGVRAVLRRPDGREEICQAAYLAGCDGASSIVRETLAIGFPGGTYAGRFYVADVEASGPAIDAELHVDLDEADLLLVFPMKGEGCVRLVGNVHEEPARGRKRVDVRRRQPACHRAFATCVGKVNWFSTYRVHHRVAHHFRQGRAFLLGDAAHIHSPVGGQGMNTGIGDAVNLAWKLAAVLSAARPTTVCSRPTSWSESASPVGWSPRPTGSSPWRRRKGASPGSSAPGSFRC